MLSFAPALFPDASIISNDQSTIGMKAYLDLVVPRLKVHLMEEEKMRHLNLVVKRDMESKDEYYEFFFNCPPYIHGSRKAINSTFKGGRWKILESIPLTRNYYQKPVEPRRKHKVHKRNKPYNIETLQN